MHDPGQNILDKLKKLNKRDFFIDCFTADFSQFSSTIPKDFLKILEFPKILSFKSSGNSWGNSYIHCSMIIV